jgi:hypothetical protein
MPTRWWRLTGSPTAGSLGGSKAIRGRIELADDGSLPESVWRGHAEEGRLRHERLLSDTNPTDETQHWQFSGASMTLTAAVYTQVGGLELLTALEDEHLERALRHHDVPIHRLLSIRVTTSSGGKGHTTPFIRPSQNSTQPSRGTGRGLERYVLSSLYS